MSSSYLILTKKPLVFPSGTDQRVIVPNENGSIGIKTIQKFIQWSYLKPYENEYKVGIINPSDALTIEAQNALLKTLEEPPEKTNIILITYRKESLVDTIRSRCQIFPLHKAVDLLFPKILINPSISIQSDAVDSSLISDYIQTVTQDNLVYAFGQFEDVIKKSDRTEILSLLEQCIVDLYQKMKDERDISYLKLAGHLDTARKHIAGNVNIKLALEHMYMEIKNDALLHC